VPGRRPRAVPGRPGDRDRDLDRDPDRDRDRSAGPVTSHDPGDSESEALSLSLTRIHRPWLGRPAGVKLTVTVDPGGTTVTVTVAAWAQSQCRSP
jgi:hypothetical protein